MAKVFNLVLCVSKWHFDFWPNQDEFSALNTIESIVTSHPLLTWSWDTQYKSNKKITKNKTCSFSFFVLVGLWTDSFPLLLVQVSSLLNFASFALVLTKSDFCFVTNFRPRSTMWWILSTDTSWAIALHCVRLRTAKRWKTKIQSSNTMTGEWVLSSLW